MTQRKLFIAADEFYRSPVFLIGCFAIYDSQKVLFDKLWDELRVRIKRQLLIDAPRLSEHKKLIGDQLPEIHAVDMIQSDSYYHLEENDPGFCDRYWFRQYAWLEEALRIMKRFNPKIFFYASEEPKEKLDELKAESHRVYVENFPDKRNTKRAKTFAQLRSWPYYSALPMVLAGLHHYALERNCSAEMLFDDFDHSKGFYEQDIFNHLHATGRLSKSFSARHDSSIAHNLLQAADVASYVRGRALFWEHVKKDEVGARLYRWDKKYLVPDAVTDRAQMFAEKDLTLLLFINLINTICLPYEGRASGNLPHAEQLLSLSNEVLREEENRRQIRALLDQMSQSQSI